MKDEGRKCNGWENLGEAGIYIPEMKERRRRRRERTASLGVIMVSE
jgi:hypothetical protein